MKNTKIFPKDWLELHPYKQSGPIELYYSNIANRIYNYMEQTDLASSFEENEVKQISMRMTAYFEDVISQTNIWRTFITTYKEKFGKYLPFYTPDDHYYDDEVNLEDIRFLLWHYTQQYHGYSKSTFVNPDNLANEKTTALIYQLFCDEWTTAPENKQLQQFFSTETSYSDPEKYVELLIWFHYNSYLFTDHNKELTNTVKDVLENYPEKRKDINTVIIQAYEYLAYTHPTALLALTSPEWLYRIMPANHPAIVHFKTMADESRIKIPEDVKKQAREDYEKFIEVAGGKILIYAKDLNEAKDFIIHKIGIVPENDFYYPANINNEKLAIYATPEDGVCLIHSDIEAIKDENNPFYDENIAQKNGLSFFIVKHCSSSMLKILEERGMLADAQTKSTINPERGKSIIHENWQFLSRYFLREE